LVWRVGNTIRITKTKSGSTVTTKVNALHADGALLQNSGR
jgi:hypothetical protein